MKKLTMVSEIEGILKIANIVLSGIAGIIAVTLIRYSTKKKDLRPWILLVFALVFFIVQEILGMLRAFGVYESPFLTHLVPTIILVLVLFAAISQLNLKGGS